MYMVVRIPNQEVRCQWKLLNVVVDKLVGDYQDQLGAYRPITHMYPFLPAVLEINRMAITINVRHQLINTYVEPKYMQYIQRKNKWNNKQYIQ